MNVFSTLTIKFTLSGKFAEMGGKAIRLEKFFQRVESKPSEAQKMPVYSTGIILNVKSKY